MLRARTFAAALALLTISSGGNAESFDDWYQVEVIVFSQLSPGDSDESWAVRELSYPDEMVMVEATGPHLLQHLESLDRYAAIFSDDGVPAADAGADEFLFEDRSRLSTRERMEARLRALQQRQRSAEEATPDTFGESSGQSSGESAGINPGGDSLADDSRRSGEDDETRTGDALMITVDEIDLETLLDADRIKAFSPVDSDQRFLNSVARSLGRSSRFRLLTHIAWRQPILEGESWPLLVQTGEQYGDMFEVDGTLTIRRSRFLHVDADLWFTRFAENEVAPVRNIPETIDPARARDFPELLSALRNQDRYFPVHTHRLGASRRMRRSELHYIDHPYFGVIVQVERYEGSEKGPGTP